MAYDDRDWGRRTLGPTSYGSVKERRSLMWNDSDPQPPPAAPPSGSTDTYKGKFFTRGCRGMIEEIQIYRTATAAGTITLQFSPHPCLGPFHTLVVPAGPADAWTGVAFEQMWDYDSLFIWISELDAGEAWGYDAVLPYDGHEYTPPAPPDPPEFCPWFDLAIRPFIRVVYTGETPGDVPVSGIINNIKIPNVSSDEVTQEAKAVPQLALTDIVVPIDGAGYCDLMLITVRAAANSEQTQFRVICDGQTSFSRSPIQLNTRGVGVATPGMTLTQYGAAGMCTLVLTKLFEFKRQLRVTGYNPLGAQNMDAYVFPTLLE